MISFLWLCMGAALLIGGAHWLVAGAAALARRLGVSVLIIGLTVVAFGTSAPELAVSVKAALDGETGVSVGNVVGSNIFNVLCILGICGLITPLAVSAELIRKDLPIMLAASGLVWWMASDGRLSVPEAAALLSGLLAYLASLYWRSRQLPQAPEALVPLSVPAQLVRILSGLVLLVVGARLTVQGAVELATALGVSQTIIGLTLVAGATSLPELVTSLVAARRGHADMAVGNVVGSNIFNLLAVLGLAGLVSGAPLAIGEQLLRLDIPLMTAVALVCLPVFFTGRRIDRAEAAWLLGSFVAYLCCLVLEALQHPFAAPLEMAAKLLLLPVGLLLIAQSVQQSQHRDTSPPQSGRS